MPAASSGWRRRGLEIDFQNRVRIDPMIVCSCRGISDREVVEAVRCGARTLEDVSRRCDGAGEECGSCVVYIAQHLGGSCEGSQAA
jgi:bacterioferritin-associated ferredoxin